MRFQTASESSKTRPGKETRELPSRSAWLFHYFSIYVERFVRKNFTAVRVSADSTSSVPVDAPLIVVLNHPAWWDPMVGVLLAKRLFPDRPHYAPIDAEALKKYRVLGKLGFFGVEQGTLSGARDFLGTCGSIFELSHNAVVWVTAQGAFTDPRSRPVSIKPGVAHLATRIKAGGILPLAIEYPFWNERYPEVLARFGELLPLSERRGTQEWEVSIARALESTMDALTDIALLRDPRRFETLLTGSVGEGGLYDAFRRISTWFRGEQFHPGHDNVHHKAT